MKKKFFKLTIVSILFILCSFNLFVNLKDSDTEIYYVTIATITGRIVMMLPQPEWQNGIDISSLESGVYTFQMMDKQTKSLTTRKFIKK